MTIFGRTKNILWDFQFPVQNAWSLEVSTVPNKNEEEIRLKSQFLFLDSSEQQGHKVKPTPELKWWEAQSRDIFRNQGPLPLLPRKENQNVIDQFADITQLKDPQRPGHRGFHTLVHWDWHALYGKCSGLIKGNFVKGKKPEQTPLLKMTQIACEHVKNAYHLTLLEK